MIANVCVTGSAGAYVSSPACVAVIVHEPTLVMWTVVPDTEHAPDAEKLDRQSRCRRRGDGEVRFAACAVRKAARSRSAAPAS